MNFSVMTFNLRVNNSGDGQNAWPYRVKKVSDVLKSCTPLIVGTQEGLNSMLSDLQRDTPEYGMIGEGRGGGKEDEYSAIFYKTSELECVDHDQFWLSESPLEPNSISWGSACPRICTWGKFRFVNEPTLQFYVYNTHLDHVSQKARENSLQLILDKMTRHLSGNAPVILMGDMNAGPRSKEIELLHGHGSMEGDSSSLRDAYSVLKNPPGATFHNFQGNEHGQPIDYIFVSSNVEILETRINRGKVNGAYPSDHYPVMATLSI